MVVAVSRWVGRSGLQVFFKYYNWVKNISTSHVRELINDTIDNINKCTSIKI